MDITQIKDGFISFATSAYETTVEAGSFLGKKVVELSIEAADVIQKCAAVAFDYLAQAFNATGEFAGIAFEATREFAGDAFEATCEFSKNAFDATSAFSITAFNTACEYSGIAFNAASEFTKTAFNATCEFSSQAFEATCEFSTQAFEATCNFSTEVYHSVAEFTANTYQATAQYTNETAIPFFNETIIPAAKEAGEQVFAFVASPIGATAVATATSATFATAAIIKKPSYKTEAELAILEAQQPGTTAQYNSDKNWSIGLGVVAGLSGVVAVAGGVFTAIKDFNLLDLLKDNKPV